MNLASLLTTEQVIPDLKSTDHNAVIEELVSHLCAKGFLPEDSKEETLAALAEREEKISTGIGSGVAIPHAFSESLSEVVAIFGRSKAGVNFDSIDNNPVHYIVLFVVPKEQYQLHLCTLAAIAKLFTRAEIRDQLHDAADEEEILAVFNSQVVCA